MPWGSSERQKRKEEKAVERRGTKKITAHVTATKPRYSAKHTGTEDDIRAAMNDLYEMGYRGIVAKVNGRAFR